MPKQLTIDNEFRDLLPPLTVDEKFQLRFQIQSDGCTDQIIVWAEHENTIIDGHHRYDICLATGVPFKINAIKFKTRDAVIAWILTRQGGRRNISHHKLRYIRGTAYNKRKCSHGNANGEARKSGRKVLKDHDDLLETTAAVVAKEYGVGEATIKRDAKFAEALDELTATQRNAILNGTRKELPGGTETSHKTEILARLREGPAIRQNLQVISPLYTARVSDLRTAGYNIVHRGDLYTLESGKGNKKPQPLPKRFRYEKPEGTDAAIDRIREIGKELRKISRGTRFQVNHQKIIRFASELVELVHCFEAGKK